MNTVLYVILLIGVGYAIGYALGRGNPYRFVVQREHEAERRQLAKLLVGPDWVVVATSEGINQGPLGEDLPSILLDWHGERRLRYSYFEPASVGDRFTIRFRTAEETTGVWYAPYGDLLIAEKVTRA